MSEQNGVIEMSVRYSPERRIKAYDETYAELKARGLSDRDADIITIGKMYPRPAISGLAKKHGISVEEVKEIYNSYYSS